MMRLIDADALLRHSVEADRMGAMLVVGIGHIFSALRDAQARQEGCEYCRPNDWERKPLGTFEIIRDDYSTEEHEIGIDDFEGGYRIASTIMFHGPSFDINFCPVCGKSLEPVGNADTLPTVFKTESVGQGPEPGGEVE